MPKKPIYGECAKMFSYRLYSWEKGPVKEFIKKLRIEKRKEYDRNRLQARSNKKSL